MRILLINGDEVSDNSVRPALEAAGFEVAVAAVGEGRLEHAQENDYRLLIFHNLPRETGLNVCRKLRNVGTTIPILIVSAKADIQSKTDFLNAGADDYVAEPFVIEEVAARIRALFRRSPQLQSDAFQIGDLALDTQTRRATRTGATLELTRIEFMLLEWFARNNGVVLSRDNILTHVWASGVDPATNTVTCHIASLRRKLRAANSQAAICTIPCQGYKLEIKS